MTLTQQKLARISAGATLVAFPMELPPELDAKFSDNVYPSYFRDFVNPPVAEGECCDPTLPGKVWGKARAVRRDDVSNLDWWSLSPIWTEEVRRELGDADWLWLVEVVPVSQTKGE